MLAVSQYLVPCCSRILRDQEAARLAVGVNPSGMWQCFLDGLSARYREDSHLSSRHCCPRLSPVVGSMVACLKGSFSFLYYQLFVMKQVVIVSCEQ